MAKKRKVQAKLEPCPLIGLPDWFVNIDIEIIKKITEDGRRSLAQEISTLSKQEVL